MKPRKAPPRTIRKVAAAFYSSCTVVESMHTAGQPPLLADECIEIHFGGIPCHGDDSDESEITTGPSKSTTSQAKSPPVAIREAGSTTAWDHRSVPLPPHFNTK
eukprot:Sspe_Gene.30287::Locus_14944_Transcript_1_1_Confidence_1.000_Length_460::g.30287::m.30287